MDRELIRHWLWNAAIIIGIIALGLFAWNQFILWHYSSAFLTSPCQKCVELNPEWKECYNYITRPIYYNDTNPSPQSFKINFSEFLTSSNSS